VTLVVFPGFAHAETSDAANTNMRPVESIDADLRAAEKEERDAAAALVKAKVVQERRAAAELRNKALFDEARAVVGRYTRAMYTSAPMELTQAAMFVNGDSPSEISRALTFSEQVGDARDAERAEAERLLAEAQRRHEEAQQEVRRATKAWEQAERRIGQLWEERAEVDSGAALVLPEKYSQYPETGRFDEENMQPRAIALGRALVARVPGIVSVTGWRPLAATTDVDYVTGQVFDVNLPRNAQKKQRTAQAVADWLMKEREDGRVVALHYRGRVWNYAGDKTVSNKPAPFHKWPRDTAQPSKGKPDDDSYIRVTVDGPIPLQGQPEVPESRWRKRGFTQPPPPSAGRGWVFPVARFTPASIGSDAGMRLHPILGYVRCHYGADISAPTGTPVVAAHDGVVLTAGSSGGYGNLVTVAHNGGVETRYAHLSAINVKEGQRVTAGARLGAVGSTGLSTGPHLHFEVRSPAGIPYRVKAWYADRRETACRSAS
jgi:murein DD-endopeptidase MepM/ murein hydrolase activator NlpD